MTTPAEAALPIQATPTFVDGGWSVRLPVRAEQITISKQTLVRERVLVTRRRVEEAARVDAVLRHEELRTQKSGPVEVTENDPTGRADGGASQSITARRW